MYMMEVGYDFVYTQCSYKDQPTNGIHPYCACYVVSYSTVLDVYIYFASDNKIQWVRCLDNMKYREA